MNFFERRKMKKHVRHLLHEARHVRHMREDVADPAAIQALESAESELSEAWKALDRVAIESAAERLAERVGKVQPERPDARIREIVEIVVIAVAAAMALRAYFVQPFKIPTGSMQPTLYGITYEPSASPGLTDARGVNLVKLFLTGRRYAEIKASADGIVSFVQRQLDGHTVIVVGNREYRAFPGMVERVAEGDLVRKGQALASGIRKSGDHIFVDKVSYNFRRPRRGDVFVFNTDGITHEQIQRHSFYIKRLVALPGELVQIHPPHLVIDGRKIEEPEGVARVTAGVDGYYGYRLAEHHPSILNSRAASLLLGPGEYLPLGDNTRSSLDGRYFGPVRNEQVVGPAFMVYWPFTRRWGLVDR